MLLKKKAHELVLQDMSDRRNALERRSGMEINVEKTKVIRISRNRP